MVNSVQEMKANMRHHRVYPLLVKLKSEFNRASSTLATEPSSKDVAVVLVQYTTMDSAAVLSDYTADKNLDSFILASLVAYVTRINKQYSKNYDYITFVKLLRNRLNKEAEDLVAELGRALKDRKRNLKVAEPGGSAVKARKEDIESFLEKKRTQKNIPFPEHIRNFLDNFISSRPEMPYYDSCELPVICQLTSMNADQIKHYFQNSRDRRMGYLYSLAKQKIVLPTYIQWPGGSIPAVGDYVRTGRKHAGKYSNGRSVINSGKAKAGEEEDDSGTHKQRPKHKITPVSAPAAAEKPKEILKKKKKDSEDASASEEDELSEEEFLDQLRQEYVPDQPTETKKKTKPARVSKTKTNGNDQEFTTPVKKETKKKTKTSPSAETDETMPESPQEIIDPVPISLSSTLPPLVVLAPREPLPLPEVHRGLPPNMFESPIKQEQPRTDSPLLQQDLYLDMSYNAFGYAPVQPSVTRDMSIDDYNFYSRSVYFAFPNMGLEYHDMQYYDCV